MRRIVVGTAVAVIGVVAGLAGCSGGDDAHSEMDPELWARAQHEIRDCLANAGFDSLPAQVEWSEEEIAAGDPLFEATKECEDDVFFRPEFQALGFDYEVDTYEEWVADSWELWRCLEESGYTRVTPIPLMFEGGRPISPMFTNFDVPNEEADVERFYETAAECGEPGIEAYMIQDEFIGRNGGQLGCAPGHEGDPGYDEETGCFLVDDYPPDL